MNEGEIIKDFEQIPQERIKALKKAAKRVQKLGIDDWAQRRELVIDAESIAVEEKERRKKEQKQEIKEEDKGTKEAAEKEAQPVKRENIYELNDEELASIDSVAQAAIDQESDLTKETAINKYLEVKRGTLSDVIVDAVHTFRPRPIDVFQLLKDKITGLTYEQVKQALEKIESGQSLEGVDERLIKAFDLFDEETGELADRVVELSGASCIKAKKPRTFTDLNRNWFKRATQKIGEVTTFAR